MDARHFPNDSKVLSGLSSPAAEDDELQKAAYPSNDAPVTWRDRLGILVLLGALSWIVVGIIVAVFIL